MIKVGVEMCVGVCVCLFVCVCVCVGLCLTPLPSFNTMIRSSPACSRKKKTIMRK